MPAPLRFIPEETKPFLIGTHFRNRPSPYDLSEHITPLPDTLLRVLTPGGAHARPTPFYP